MGQTLDELYAARSAYCIAGRCELCRGRNGTCKCSCHTWRPPTLTVVPERVVEPTPAEKQRALRQERFDTIVRRYREGATQVAIAAELGISQPTVAGYLDRAGIESRGYRHRVDIPIAEAARRYRLGWRLKDLAAEYRCSIETIRNRLHRAGVAIREPGGFQR